MPRIAFVQEDGTTRIVDAQSGESLMRAAVEGGVDGIDAECGGACACATCQVHIGAEWMEKVGRASGSERDMLEGLALDLRPESRLSCQITVTDDLDSMTVEVATR